MKLRALPATAILAILILGAAFPLPARAQIESREAIALENEIAELRQTIQIMQQNQQGAGQAAPQVAPPAPYEAQPQPQQAQGGVGSDTAAELVVRVGALEEQTRQLQGRVDDLANQLQRQHDEMAKQISDLSFKLGQAGGASGGIAPQPDPAPDAGAIAPAEPPAKPAAKPAPAHRTPEQALHDGNAALARRDYAAAAQAARDANPGRGPRGNDAQLLLARAEGGEGDFKSAAADYYRVYTHAPKAASAPVALLGVANTLIALKDTKDACVTLTKLSVEFPNALKPGVASARKRAECRK
jgi:TolA-binding protein